MVKLNIQQNNLNYARLTNLQEGKITHFKKFKEIYKGCCCFFHLMWTYNIWSIPRTVAESESPYIHITYILMVWYNIALALPTYTTSYLSVASSSRYQRKSKLLKLQNVIRIFIYQGKTEDKLKHKQWYKAYIKKTRLIITPRITSIHMYSNSLKNTNILYSTKTSCFLNL